MSLEADVRELVDRQAILDVLHRYCYLVDIQDLDGMVDEVFAPDGSGRIDRRALVSNGESVVGLGSLPETQRGIHALAEKTTATR